MHAWWMLSRCGVEVLNCSSGTYSKLGKTATIVAQPERGREESNELACRQDHAATNKTGMAPTIMESSQREYMGADRGATGHSHSSGSIFSDKTRARSAHTSHLSSTLTPAGACQQARKRTRRRHFLLEHDREPDAASRLCSRDHFSRSRTTAISWKWTGRSIEQTKQTNFSSDAENITSIHVVPGGPAPFSCAPGNTSLIIMRDPRAGKSDLFLVDSAVHVPMYVLGVLPGLHVRSITRGIWMQLCVMSEGQR